MTPSEATAAKFMAMEVIIKDNTLSRCDVSLSYLLIMKYFNADDGYAWPSRDRLAEELDVDKSTITKALKRLEDRGHFHVKRNKGRGKTNKYYPNFSTEKGAWTLPINTEKGAPTPPINDVKGRVDAHKRARGRAPTLPKTLFKDSKRSAHNEKDPADDRTRGTRLPKDWRPDAECREFAVGLGLDPDRVAERFGDHWIAVPGSKAIKLDWPATWRNWCRGDAERAAERPVNGSSPQGIVAGALADIAALEGHV
jgi:biotin operon repressor